MPKPLRVLFVEDSPEDAELLWQQLSAGGFEVAGLRVDTAEAMQHALDSQTWDVVLSDFSMPGFGGSAALTLLRQRHRDVPFLIVSGTIGEDTAVEALKAGANDFLVKGRLARFVPALERELRDAEARRDHHALAVALSESQARATFALEAAGAGVWEVDLSTQVTRWSEQVSVMFGLPPTSVETDLAGFRDHVHRDDLPMVDGAMSRAHEIDAPYRVEFRSVWADGTIRWIAAKGRVARAASSGSSQLMAIFIDVSDRKDLEHKLQHAHKMESLGQFAGGIAHDFNHVLSVVLGFGELLLSDLDPADAGAADLREITKAAAAGKQLTRQLLAFSRQQPIEPAALDLNQAVTHTTGILQQLLGRSVRLETSLHATGVVWADAGQVQQILLNLAANARDAMPSGGRLCVDTRCMSISPSRAAGEDVRAGDYIVLAVSDTGGGMPPEVQERIFEPFFTTKAPGKGTGFGLAVVYSIVRQSDGFMEVASIVGAGTTFRIYLPRLDSTASDSTPAAKPRHTQSAAESR